MLLRIGAERVPLLLLLIVGPLLRVCRVLVPRAAVEDFARQHHRLAGNETRVRLEHIRHAHKLQDGVVPRLGADSALLPHRPVRVLVIDDANPVPHPKVSVRAECVALEIDAQSVERLVHADPELAGGGGEVSAKDFPRLENVFEGEEVFDAPREKGVERARRRRRRERRSAGFGCGRLGSGWAQQFLRLRRRNAPHVGRLFEDENLGTEHHRVVHQKPRVLTKEAGEGDKLPPTPILGRL
mmetsp:Transcript_1637/g.5995  ORF Transcript_1637/g.5995 Transcript_1637/m.5995 type:complete len:241 (-) Transcript_1637:1654-2376(-)